MLLVNQCSSATILGFLKVAKSFRIRLIIQNSSDLAGQLAKFDNIDFRGRSVRILEDDFGFIYSSAVHLKNGEIKWRCSKRNAWKCTAFINTRGGYIVRSKADHNHELTNVHQNNRAYPYDNF